MLNRRLTRRGAIAVISSTAALTVPVSFAQTYPDRQIAIVVPFAAGGTVDLVARAVAAPLSRAVRSPVIVRNEAGASAEIGTASVVRSAPDGYTLLMGSTTSISIRPQMNPPLAYDTQRDLVPIALAASVPHVLLVSPSTPARSVAELVAHARTARRPLSLGDSGPGSPHALAGALFRQAVGIELTHVSYRGTSAVLNDLLAGHIDIASIELSVASTYLKSDRLRAIGLSAARRDPAWPNLATIAEQGVSGYEITSWFGLFAPTGTSANAVSFLNTQINQVLSEPGVRDALTGAGLTVVGGSTADFHGHLAREREKWARAIQASGASLRSGS